MRLLHRDRTDPTTIDERRTDAVRVAPSSDHTTETRPRTDPDGVAPPDRTDVVDRTDMDRTDVVDRTHADHRDADRRDADRRDADRRDADRRAAGTGAAAGPTTVRERTWTFAPGQLVSFAAGAATVAVGLVALLRAGVDASLAQPTVDVFGYTHTAWLALAEIGLGLLLLLAGSGAWGRPLSVLIGAATVVAGVLVLTVPDEMPAELGLEAAFGWPLVALGAVVALAAMALPVWRRRTIA